MKLLEQQPSNPPLATLDERYDRQQRIPGWNQEALASARVGVAGDDPWLTGLFVAAAAALGIGRLTVVSPSLDPRLLQAARGLHPALELNFFPGCLTHPLLEDVFSGCQVLVDLSHFALAGKILVEVARRRDLPLIQGYCPAMGEEGALKLFTYLRGREWRDLGEVMAAVQLPSRKPRDPVLAVVLAGLALEETKKLLFKEPVTTEVVRYPSERETPEDHERSQGKRDPQIDLPHLPLALVGAGALGNFVALGLAVLGCTALTIFDPDPVEVSNLNRQILFWDAVGRPKAEALAGRMAAWFGIKTTAAVTAVTRETELAGFAAVFDCTDNFESRILLSEKCREGGLILISGGTGVTAGQVVPYDPRRSGRTPAEFLGLYDIVGQRERAPKKDKRASCLYVPEPAVIMTNQVVAGLMVDSFRRLLKGELPPPRFYQTDSPRML